MTIPLIERARDRAGATAIVAADGDLRYRDLLERSGRMAAAFQAMGDRWEGERIAFLVPPIGRYAVVQWAIWRCGAIAVPLCLTHPERELEYVVDDCRPRALVAVTELRPRLQAIARSRGLALLDAEALEGGPEADLPEVGPDRAAMIIYTSGTTGGPKGVVTSHRNIAAQIAALIEAWAWSERDRILLTLPLHHVHGVINVLGCALWAGATCEMLPRFDAEVVWRRFVDGDLTLFMAVPTIYARLAEAWERTSARDQERWSAAARRLRLMVSGSAALPIRLFERWREISGHTLLERYGMTEIGMALSNPLRGERRPGCVGQPLPGVEVRRVDGRGRLVEDATPGEIEVRGGGVFAFYWQRPRETAAAFRDGWFRTGDVAVVEEGSYRLLGRQSVDILKSGGYKISALEVEEVLREHPQIVDCAVVGLPDEEWGDRVAAVVVLRGSSPLDLTSLRAWAKERLAPYKIPRSLLVVGDLPRNSMGKVSKPAVQKLFAGRPREIRPEP